MKWHLDKERYKKLIEESPLFLLNKEKELALYKRETYKLIENIVAYMLAVDDDKNKEYGMEIAEVANRCIKFYDTSKGGFLSYFLSSWRIEFGRINAREIVDRKLCGIRITEEDKAKIRKIIKYAQINNKDYHSTDFVTVVSEAMGLTIDEINELIEMADLEVCSDITENEDGKEFNIIDIQMSSEKCQEETYEEVFAAVDFLRKIERFFVNRQDRQKPLLSKLITSKILEEVDACEELYNEVKNFAFFDNDMYLAYKKDRIVPTARDIASIYNLSEQSVSRTYRIFINCVKH